MTTSHELARQLLALPDLPVYAANGASGVIEPVGSASFQEHDDLIVDFGLDDDITGWVEIYTGN